MKNTSFHSKEIGKFLNSNLKSNAEYYAPRFETVDENLKDSEQLSCDLSIIGVKQIWNDDIKWTRLGNGNKEQTTYLPLPTSDTKYIRGTNEKNRKLIKKFVLVGRRLLWITSLLACCVIVAYYVTNRLLLMMSLPTQVSVILKQNDSLRLPDVTLCPNTPFRPDKLREMGLTEDGLPSYNYSLESFLNLSQLWQDLSSPHKIISASSVNFVNTRENWKTIFTTMGACISHQYDGEIQASGLSFGMSISIKWNEVAHSKLWSDLDGIKVFFHERKDEPLTEVEGINVAPREDLSIAIRIKEFKSLNRKEHPCISKFHYSRSVCVNKCFNRNLHQLIKCRLPFMSEAIGNWCYPADIYSQAMKTFWEESKSNLELWAECGKVCPIECQKLIYTPYVESVVVAAEESIGKFKIYFPEMWYEIVEQKDSYDTIAFLCDVGGTFGLFLGCSVLTAVEIIEMFVLLVTRNRVASPPGRN